MGIRRHKVLYDASAAANGDWFRLDSRYEVDAVRVLQLDIVSGDTITLQGTTVDVRGGNPDVVTAGLAADDITDIDAFTASADYNLTGPWTYIRAVKTVETGNAKVQGFI